MVTPYTPDDRLARQRIRDERWMPSLCDIHHPGAGGVNPDGSGTTTADTVVTGIPCRIDLGATAAETLIAMRLTDVASGLISVPVGTLIGPKDRIVVGALTYEVMGTDSGQSYPTNITAAVRDIT